MLRIGSSDVPGHVNAMNNWKNIRLELARTSEFPAGSVSRGYLIRLPLNDDDRVDRDTLAGAPHKAIVRRYWSTEPDEAGLVLPANGGWAMRCDGRPDRRLEIDGCPIRLGQQVSVVDTDGDELPFRVASVS
jgi:hypothetical protein